MDDTTLQPKPSQDVEPAKIIPPTIEEKKEEPKPIEIPQENWKISPLFYEVASYLGVDEKEYERAAPKLSLIVDWAIGEANSNKIADILPVLGNILHQMSPPGWGETKWNNLYSYLRLRVKRDAFDKALGAFMDKKEGHKNG